MPSCQALAPATVAALAWDILRLTIADGASSWAMTQRRTALIAAVPPMPMPHRLIKPPVATSAKPTIRALELVELIWTRVIDFCERNEVHRESSPPYSVPGPSAR